jgi:hypothetical protein
MVVLLKKIEDFTHYTCILTVKGKEYVCLIDTGAGCSFSRYWFDAEYDEDVESTMLNSVVSYPVSTEGIITDENLKLKNVAYVEDWAVEDIDIILGVSFLEANNLKVELVSCR